MRSKTIILRPARRAAALLLAMAGLAAMARAQPAVVGQWTAASTWPLVASHGAMLPDGRFLIWYDGTSGAAWIWNSSTNTFTNVAAINTTVKGSTQVQLADGTIAIVGGRDATGAGLHDAHRYSLAAGTWTALPPLAEPRNEATALLLGDARILALSGELLPGQLNDIPEHFTLGNPSWTTLPGAAFGLPLTPWAFTLSTGEVLVAGPDPVSRRLNVATSVWSSGSSMASTRRDAGTAVRLPGTADRILAIGGQNPATSSCELLDLGTTTSWAPTGSMNRARRYHHATILADGKVLVTGGTLVDDDLGQSVYPAEIYNSTTGAWTLMASMAVSRRKGSIAMLLPDARVVCAGGGEGTMISEAHGDAQIFSPPYLFLGTRPVITVAPANVLYDGTFTVDSPQATDIDAVWLVRAGAVTRGFNGDQRAVPLPFTAAPGRLTVTAPTNPNQAPPGTYMLFLVDDAGVPSVAAMVNVHAGVPVPVPPQITSTPPTEQVVNTPYNYIPAASGSAPLTWSLPTNPGWLSVSPGTGAVAGVPPTTGMFVVKLRATNSGGFNDQSWTLNVISATSVRTVIPLGATWKYFKGNANPGASWAALVFSDGTWLTGASGFGFGDSDDATVLSDMVDNYSTIFTRKAFTVYNVNTVSKISILHEYDDGLAVFLNGTRILAKNAPATITNTSVALNSHEASANLIRQDFTDATTRALLVNGTNMLAAVVLNSSIGSNDVTLKVVLELTGGTDNPVDAGERAEPAALLMAGPNPSSGAVAVRFRTVERGAARVGVFDAAGRMVRRWFADDLPAGTHAFTWDGLDTNGAVVAPGVYLYRLEAPGLQRTGKWTRTALRR